MYLPNTFREDDLETLHAMIRAHPLATLITAGAGGLLADRRLLVSARLARRSFLVAILVI